MSKTSVVKYMLALTASAQIPACYLSLMETTLFHCPLSSLALQVEMLTITPSIFCVFYS